MSTLKNVLDSAEFYNLYSTDKIRVPNMNYANEAMAALNNHANSVVELTSILEKVNETDIEQPQCDISVVFENFLNIKNAMEPRLLKLLDICLQHKCTPQFHEDPMSCPSSARKNIIQKKLGEINRTLRRIEEIRSSDSPCPDLVFKIYNKAINSKFEERIICLITEKKNFETLCAFELSKSQKLSQMITNLQTEQKQALEAVDFIQKLKNWYLTETCLEGEKEACYRILSCYIEQGSSLNLSNCSLNSLPEIIGDLRSLTRLNISNNQLTSLSPKIGKLQNLEDLNISWNKLQALPPEIGKFQNLEKLDISHNEFQVLPPEIGKFQHLERLNISHNKLQVLPPEIGNLLKVTNLHIEGNPLQASAISLDKLSTKEIKTFLEAQITQQQNTNSQHDPNFRLSVDNSNQSSTKS